MTVVEPLNAFESLFRLSEQLLRATDTDAVCAAAVTTAVELSNEEYVTLLLLDDSSTRLIVRGTHGWDPGMLGQPGVPLGRASQSGYAILQREAVVCGDYDLEERFVVPDSVREKNLRSGLAVPLFAGDQAHGALMIHAPQPDAFVPQTVRWLMLLANQAAVALDKVRLYEDESRRAEQLNLINEISRRLNRSLDPDEQIRGVVEAMAELFGYSDVMIMLLDDAGHELVAHSAAGAESLGPQVNYRQPVDRGVMGHVVRTGRAYVCSRAADDPYYIRVAAHPPMDAEVCVPLINERGLFGVLNIEGPDPPGLHFEDQVLAETVADQLATALSNAHQYREARTRLDHLLALQQTVLDIAGQRHVHELLRRIVERAAGLLGAEGGALYMLRAEASELELVVAHNVSPNVLGAHVPLGSGLAGRVAQTGEPLAVDDYSAWEGRWREHVDWSVGAIVGVPMKWQGRVLGELSVWLAPGGRRFAPDEMWLLSLYADQAAVAIESARLLDAEQQRRERLDALYQIAQVLNATLDTRAILTKVVDEAMRATAATHGQVLLVNETEGVFERHVLRGFPAGLAERNALPLTRGLNGRAYHTRQIILAGEVTAEPDYAGLVPETRSELVVPIIRGSAVVANIDLQSPHAAGFASADLDFLRALADQAAVALENARLLESARRRLAELGVLHEVAVEAATAMDVDALVAGVTAILARGLYGDNVGMLLTGPDGLLHYHSSYRGLAREELPIAYAPGAGVCGMVLQTGQPMLVGDTSVMAGISRPDARLRAQLCVPLAAGGEVIGVLNTASLRVGAYGEADLRLLSTLAGPVATAIEKLRLRDAERQHAVELESRVRERTRALQEQTERTEAILRSVVEPVFMLDPGGELRLCNPVAEVLLADEDLGPRLRATARRMVATSEQPAPEILRGVGLTLEAHGSHVTTGTERLGTVIVLHDVTRLYELNRLKSEFVSSVSHELRTPLTNMKMYVNLLQKGRPERQAGYVETLRRETWRLERLVEDLLTISRLDMGALQVKLQPVQLNGPLAMLVADREVLAAQRGLGLQGKWSPDAPEALADEQLIVLAVGNVVSKAVAYTPPGGRVVVRTEAKVCDGARWLAIRVSDTGPGIRPIDAEHIFERFYRGEAAHASSVPGTGLGLAIVKEIVERHRGQVSVSSAPGHGATFTILLPAAGADEDVRAGTREHVST